MLKYNSKFAQLVGKLRSNTEKIEEIVLELPHAQLIDSIRKDIHGLDSTTQSFNRHFMDLKSKIAEAGNDFLSVRKTSPGDI